MADTERLKRIQRALEAAGLDAIVCALPAYVLMTSGYWPVVGTSIALTTREGRSLVLAPKDEEDLAKRGWAEVRTYEPSSLSQIRSVAEAAAEPLRQAARDLGLEQARVGYERGPASEPASYVGMHLFGGSMLDLLHETMPGATLLAADNVLAELAEVKTAAEVECVRRACRIAERAFIAGASWLAIGVREPEAAAMFRSPLSIAVPVEPVSGSPLAAVDRADGFVFCMSGVHSAEAYEAYARSRAWKEIAAGELALVHCNSYADGYWTDITRTYSLGAPADRAHRMYEAVLVARESALKSIRPGVYAREVDRAAREEIKVRGFEKEFRHSTGHGVGFAAISANARPRIHPQSSDVLQPGMVFNVEPAVYVEGFGGVRHCDVVAVTDTGVEVLTPFHASMDELVIRGARAERPSELAA